MASVASQLIEVVTVHAQSDSLEVAREICADGTYFANNTHTHTHTHTYIYIYKHFISFEKQKIIIKLGGVENTLIKILWL